MSDQCAHTTKVAVFGDESNTTFKDSKEFFHIVELLPIIRRHLYGISDNGKLNCFFHAILL